MDNENPILKKLDRDLKANAGGMLRREVRFLVDRYYQAQRNRIDSEGQIRAVDQKADEGLTHELISHFHSQFWVIEKQLQNALGAYALQHTPGKWMRAVHGIGPVISAGILAHVDIERAPHAGNIMRFAGLTNDKWLGSDRAKELVSDLEAMADDPKDIEELMRLAEAKLRRQPGSIRKMMLAIFGDEEKDEEDFRPTRALLIKTLALRPWCADLKCLLTFKAGESFVKGQNSDKDFYGHIFAARKARYTIANAEGEYKADAAAILREKNISKSTDAYKAYIEGMLPKAHIHARARRYAVKWFVSDLHLVMYFCRYRELPALPYVIDHLGHSDYVPPPHLDVVPGLTEAFEKDPRYKRFLKNAPQIEASNGTDEPQE